jgi:hypothetical protein
MSQITQILMRASNTLFGDTVGVLTLAGFTYAMLHLPALV